MKIRDRCSPTVAYDYNWGERSEPPTDDVNSDRVYVYIHVYIYVPYVLPYISICGCEMAADCGL